MDKLGITITITTLVVLLVMTFSLQSIGIERALEATYPVSVNGRGITAINGDISTNIGDQKHHQYIDSLNEQLKDCTWVKYNDFLAPKCDGQILGWDAQLEKFVPLQDGESVK